MRNIGRFLMKFIFLFPVIFLSIMVWRDYNTEINNLNEHPPAINGLYYFDQGHKIAVLREGEYGNLDLRILDAKNGEVLKTTTMPSNVHNQVVGAYQQDKLVLTTYGNEEKLVIKALDPSGEVTTISQGELTLPTFLSSDIRVWRDRLFMGGFTVNNEMYVAQIRDGKLEKAILKKGDLLTVRPERIRLVNGLQDQGSTVPVFEVSLINDETAYISGILNDKQVPFVTLKAKNENSFVAQDRAEAEFKKLFKLNQTKRIAVEGDFPSQPKYFNTVTQKWGALVTTPKPLYKAIIYTLNQDEVLILGSTTEDKLEGKSLGYIVNTQSGGTTDVTPLVASLAYSDLDKAGVSFFKNNKSEWLYYNIQGQNAGVMNVANNQTEQVTEQQVQKWINYKVASVSLESFLHYLSSWNALVINWIVWVAITLFSVLGLGILPGLMRRSRMSKLAKGVVCQGTIINMKETGLYVNERPQVLFTVEFEDEGQLKTVEIKQVISFLNAWSIGDSVVISYDRKRNRAMFLTEADTMPTGSSQRGKAAQGEQTEQINNAVLEQIEKFGSIGRGRALLLHFNAAGKRYAVPVVQPIGFDYRIGEQATLLIVNGLTRIRSYGRAVYNNDSNMIQLQGKIVGIDKYSITIQNRQLMLVDVVVEEGPIRLNKSNSLFVPQGMPLKEGLPLPVSFRNEDFRKEVRLLKGKQGGAKVVDVTYSGTLGERPFAHITVERAGVLFTIEQSIEPVYGVAVGDEIWIAYDEVLREAVIINYAS
jgi:hypothetical protein